MRRTRMILVLFFTTTAVFAQNPFKVIEAAAPEQRGQLVKDFLSRRVASPYIIDSTHCLFWYYGRADTVSVGGDLNSWDPNFHYLKKISGTDLWYLVHRFPPDARLEYKMVIDGKWQLDPNNPFTATGGFGDNSEVRMPLYKTEFTNFKMNESGQGKLIQSRLFSKYLRNERTVMIYLPPEFESTETYPLVLFNDGLDFINFNHTDKILDFLIRNFRIPPVIAVFIPPVERSPEYSGEKQELFIQFISQELLPFVEEKYPVSKDMLQRCVLGVSNGGNISLVLATSLPQQIGHVAALSSYVQPDLFEKIAAASWSGRKMYLDMGKYDIPYLIPLADSLAKIMANTEVDLKYLKVHDSHNWASWREHTDEALEHMLGPGRRSKPE